MNETLMDFKEAKGYLKVSRATLYRLLQAGQVPASKVGGQWRFRTERLNSWLEELENTSKR